MTKINLNNLDFDSKQFIPRKQKIKKRKNKTEGDVKNISKGKQRK